MFAVGGVASLGRRLGKGVGRKSAQDLPGGSAGAGRDLAANRVLLQRGLSATGKLQRQIRSASDVNLERLFRRNVSRKDLIDIGKFKPSYMVGTRVEEFTTTRPTRFARVFRPKSLSRADINDAAEGDWMMPWTEVRSLTARQVQDKFALPRTPTHIVMVEVPAKTRIRSGIAGPVNFPDMKGGRGGGIQIERLRDRDGETRTTVKYGRAKQIDGRVR